VRNTRSRFDNKEEVVMRGIIVWLAAVSSVCFVSLGGVSASAQTSSSTTAVKSFEVVSVDGNKVVVKGAQGAQEITVPDDFRLTVDGRPVSVRELRPGMKGTATITTTTTVTPVYVTEVKNGTVMRVVGNSIIVRQPNGIKMFSEGEVTKRGVKIMRDGAPVAFTDLHEGDTLSAVIVTEHAPKVMTERQVSASLASASGTSGGGAAAAPSASRTASAAPAPAGTPAGARKLPKTASPLPLVGLSGAVLLTIALVLTVRRRRLG